MKDLNNKYYLNYKKFLIGYIYLNLFRKCYQFELDCILMYKFLKISSFTVNLLFYLYNMFTIFLYRYIRKNISSKSTNFEGPTFFSLVIFNLKVLFYN